MSPDFDKAVFRLTGSKADILLHVSAQFVGTVISEITTSLAGLSESNLILQGNDSINAYGNQLNNILIGTNGKGNIQTNIIEITNSTLIATPSQIRLGKQ